MLGKRRYRILVYSVKRNAMMTHYLDNAATSWPKPEAVYTRMDESFRTMFSPKRGTGEASRLGASQLQDARKSLARLLAIEAEQRICFTAGCTHSLNLAIQSFPWVAGDGIVISAVEHHALSRPVRKMVREKNLELHIVPYTTELPFDMTVYKTLLETQHRIRMVATTHASNVIGSVLPVEQIGQLARDTGKVYLLDAAQSAGLLDIDVNRMCVDMLAVPGHKSLYGPPGVGALYVGERVSLGSFMEGGTGNDSGRHGMGSQLPDMIEVGTIPLPQIMALGEGVNWVLQTGLKTIYQHEAILLQLLLDGLKALPEVTVYGHDDITRKTPVVSFNLKGYTPDLAGKRLADDFGIALRTGFHCAPMAHEALGTLKQGGTIRASLGYFTEEAAVKALLEALKTLIHQT
jgi:cysteine desulfurase / selenocysteine lyase